MQHSKDERLAFCRQFLEERVLQDGPMQDVFERMREFAKSASTFEEFYGLAIKGPTSLNWSMTAKLGTGSNGVDEALKAKVREAAIQVCRGLKRKWPELFPGDW